MTRSARKDGLSRRHCFMGRGSFTAALRSPRKIRGITTILHITGGRPGKSRFGIALTKRLVRRAVDRNRLKRLAREVFRHHRVKAAGFDLVLSPRQPLLRSDETAWVVEVGALLSRAGGDQ